MSTGAVPIPVGGRPGRPQLGRQARLAIVLALATTLLGAVGVMGYYVFTRRPITDLPVVQQVARDVAPRRLFLFAGATKPIGVAATADGQRMYVAEGGGERLIKVFDREARPIGQLAPPNSKAGGRLPGHLALDAGGRLYAVDRLRSAIDIYGPDLKWERSLIPPVVHEMGGWLPNGVTVGPDGRIYVSEVGQDEHSILVLDPDGGLVDRLGKSSGLPGGLNYPIQAAADDQGRVYISDGNAGRLLVVSPRGQVVIGSAGGEALGLPRGLAVWGQRLFLADAATHRILTFNLGDQPEYLYNFGDTDNDEGLAFPNAVAVDRTGRIYVPDRGNDRVQVWTY